MKKTDFQLLSSGSGYTCSKSAGPQRLNLGFLALGGQQERDTHTIRETGSREWCTGLPHSAENEGSMARQQNMWVPETYVGHFLAVTLAKGPTHFM